MASAQFRDATILDGEYLATLRGVFRGDLITAEDPVYESARSVWNGNVDRHPALVARCTGVADVQQAVQFGREHDVLVAVRGGGHSAPGYGTNDGGLVIDLSPMKGVRVDPSGRTARAQKVACCGGSWTGRRRCSGSPLPAGPYRTRGSPG